MNDTTAFAGSVDGIYKYSTATKTWTRLLDSSITGRSYIASGNANGKLVVTGCADSVHYQALPPYNLVDTTSAGSVTTLDISSFSGLKTIGVDYANDVYVVTNGRSYTTGEQGYSGSYVYKLVGGEWVFQDITAFLEPGGVYTDLSNKERPDGVNRILNPVDNVTLFVGTSGALYMMAGDTTITFNANGGSLSGSGI